MSDDFDNAMMTRAIDLAMRGRGRVEPNPMVGCVLTRGQAVVAEGWHHAFGRRHAEADALNHCAARGISPAGTTAYVTLEPCCHTNKKTPPCVPRLIAAGIGRLVVGAVDPNPAVAGRGLEALRQAGIVVDVSTLATSCRQLIAPFTARMRHHRPYITLKWAQSADGKVAGAGGQRVQISSDSSIRQVHALRARCDALLIGVNTALRDDPLLTARDVSQPRPLIRVVLDTHLRISPISQLVKTARNHPTWVYCASEAEQSAKAHQLADQGVVIRPMPAGRDGLADVMRELGKAGVTHLLVEPGPTLAQSFLDRNLGDRAWIFHSPMRLDEPTAPTARPMPWLVVAERSIQTDRLCEHLNPDSSVYFHPDASADIRRINAGR